MNNSAERAVLGLILLDSRAYDQAASLRPEDFSASADQLIFARMVDLRRESQPIDSIMLIDALERHSELESVGGGAYLASLVDGVPDQPSIDHYVQIVSRDADRRRISLLLEEAQRRVQDPSLPTSAVVEIAHDIGARAAAVEPLPPRFSEESLALRFSRLYGDSLRYVDGWGCWMHWDETRWVRDDTLHVLDLARGICRAASSECGDVARTVATKLASKATSAAVLRLATADRRHAARTSDWDADPWLLNTPEGTIDLRTGQIRKHRRADFITKTTAASPGGECPLWRRFLHRVTGGDLELQSFLQRIIGYVLTGSTREHGMFFLFGTGANGKSVFLSAISGLLGDYARIAPASSFTANRTEQHSTDIAGLRGARFVTASETDEGAKWDESKIKSLTGGDKIAARLMRCDFSEFTPEFKLFVAGNHKPGLRSVDEAVRRRFHLVPFTVTIPQAERDCDLGEKLRAEYAGILQWAVDGCIDWLRDGLKAPAAVRNATENYFIAEDAVGRWLDDRCVSGPKGWTASSDLFLDWKKWCAGNGEPEGSQKRFSLQIEARGFEHRNTARARGFAGISLRNELVTDVTGYPITTVPQERTPPIGEPVTSVTPPLSHFQFKGKDANANGPTRADPEETKLQLINGTCNPLRRE